MAAQLLATTDVTIERRARRLVAGATVAVRPGEAIHLHGANGSGKTTLLRVLAGLAPPSGGRVTRGGPCAFVPEKVVLTPAMRCGEWLEAMRRLRGAPPVAWATALAASGLEEGVAGVRSGALSKGMLQRVALVEAFANRAPLVLLDEPFSGLDRDGRRWLATMVDELRAGGRSCVYTDHAEAGRSALRPTGAWKLAGRRLTAVGVDERAVAELRSVVIVRGDERATHAVPAPALNDALVAFIADGWTIDEVSRP